MNSLNFEYRADGIILRVMHPDEYESVLSFYEKNRKSFDYYETSKPDNFYTPEFQAQLLKAEHDAFLKGQHVRYFLFDERFPDDIIGSISFFNIRRKDFDSCNTGYKIDEEYRRLGYGTKMVRLATHIMTHDFGMHRIEAYVMPSNNASIRLLEECGYMAEGIAKDYVRLRGEWTDHARYVYLSGYSII